MKYSITNFNPNENGAVLSLPAAAEKMAGLISNNQNASYLTDAPDNPYRLHQFEFILMYAENFSDDFIEQLALNNPPLTLSTIDILRCMALLIDEEFARQFCGKNFTLSDVNDALLEHFAKDRFAPELELREHLTAELNEVRARYETEISFLKNEREEMRNWFRESEKKQEELEKARKEASDNAAKLAVADRNQEIQKLSAELDAAKKNQDELQKELDNAANERDEALKSRDEALKELKSAKTAAAENRQTEGSDGYSGSPYGKIKFSRREESRREKVVENALMNSEYSKEQLEVIVDAYWKDLPYRCLVRMADPRFPAENLKRFETLCLKNEYGGNAGRR